MDSRTISVSNRHLFIPRIRGSGSSIGSGIGIDAYIGPRFDVDIDIDLDFVIVLMLEKVLILMSIVMFMRVY